MSKWKEHKLGDFIEVKHGFPFSGKFITDEPTQNILVTPGNFHIGGGFKNSKLKYYASSEYPEEYVFNEGDIIVTMTDLSQGTDTLGYAAKVPKHAGVRYLHNQRVGLLEFKTDEVDREFIYWLLRTRDYQGFIAGSASGTSIMHTSPSRIKEYSFLLPPLPEQTAIAEILSSLDDKIDLLQRQNKTLEAMAETLFTQWFVEEAEEGWETTRVSDVADVNPESIGKEYVHDFIQYLDTGSITMGVISDFPLMRREDAPSRAQRIVRDNDIIYSLVRPIQRHYGLLHAVSPNTIVSTGFAVLRATEISPYFLYVMLTRNDVVEFFDMVAEGSTSAYPSLRPSDIGDFEFKKPPDLALRKFHECAGNIWNKIHLNFSQIRALAAQRDLLLSKLFGDDVILLNG